MGTNYYLVNKCEHCGHEKRIHLGKMSAGWRFSLQTPPLEATPDGILAIKTWAAMREWLGKSIPEKGCIENEYGHEVTLAEFEDTVVASTRNPGNMSHHWHYGSHGRSFVDPDGFEFQTDEFS